MAASIDAHVNGATNTDAIWSVDSAVFGLEAATPAKISVLTKPLI